MKNLENSALMQEMNVNEMQEVNGGWVPTKETDLHGFLTN